MSYTQEKRLIQLDTPLGKDVLLLNSLAGSEMVSKPFSYSLDLLSESASISFDDVVGQRVSISITQAGDDKRYINGFVSRFSQSGADTRFTHYHAEVVPWLWFLTRSAACLIFQNMTVPDIVSKVFKDLGFNDFKNLLQGSYDTWDYCVQYRETAFNFVSRLMEQEGIFYFFEHEKSKHTLVLADRPNAHKPCPGQPKARMDFTSGGLLQEDVIHDWRLEQELRTGKYSLKDYNFETPSTDLNVKEPSIVSVDGNSKYEIYDYPGEYDKKGAGQTIAKTRMQEEEATHLLATGSSNCRGFVTGYRFDLEGHSRKDMNKSYVLTEVHHSASVGESYSGESSGDQGGYSNSFTCIPYSTPFRPARTTPKPFVQGPQTAVVVGRSGEEIFVDKYGRVKVQFHWDREGKRDENSSCWVRVSQPWAGKNWGAMWIPRIGQEVIVDFLEGDPDQPIITGRVYNAEQMPPYDLPDSQTQSGFKSRSSKEGTSKNFNEIRFEDKKGQEDVLIHAERTMHNSVEASQFITVGADRHIKTGYTDEDGGNHGDVKELVHNNHNLHVLANQRTKIEGESDMHVQKDAEASCDKGLTVSVGQKCIILADTIHLQGTQKIVLMAGASSVVIDASGVTVLGTPLINLNSPGAPPTPEIPPITIDPDDP